MALSGGRQSADGVTPRLTITGTATPHPDRGPRRRMLSTRLWNTPAARSGTNIPIPARPGEHRAATNVARTVRFMRSGLLNFPQVASKITGSPSIWHRTRAAARTRGSDAVTDTSSRTNNGLEFVPRDSKHSCYNPSVDVWMIICLSSLRYSFLRRGDSYYFHARIVVHAPSQSCLL